MKEKVRPALSIIAMCGVTVGFFMGKFPAETYGVIVTAIILWWFRSRDEEKKG